jgi:hypothetical protein
MPEPSLDNDLVVHETAPFSGERPQSDEPMDDEEKVLAGQRDVNMPALLTRDVQGG